jgi:hypothetical protein
MRSIAPRGSGMGWHYDEREQTLNQLLVEMDFRIRRQDERVILIAATNRPDIAGPKCFSSLVVSTAIGSDAAPTRSAASRSRRYTALGKVSRRRSRPSRCSHARHLVPVPTRERAQRGRTRSLFAQRAAHRQPALDEAWSTALWPVRSDAPG